MFCVSVSRMCVPHKMVIADMATLIYDLCTRCYYLVVRSYCIIVVDIIPCLTISSQDSHLYSLLSPAMFYIHRSRTVPRG